MTNKRNKPGEAKSQTIRDVPAACADETKAVEFLERMRWGDLPRCPRCGDTEVRKILGRDGLHAPRFLWRCYGCKAVNPKQQQFTWRIGTPAEDSRIPARCWTYALWRSATSKKGVAAKEIERQTGLTYKSALFLLQRIRFGMGSPSPSKRKRMTGTVEIDETYVGGKPRPKSKQRREAEASGALPATPESASGRTEKRPVVGLIERGGALRLRLAHGQNGRVTAATVTKFVKEHVDSSARVFTDESNIYSRFGRRFKGGHESVNHSEKEYARGDVTTNRIEGAFGILKRGIYGIWHSVSPEYLPLYLNDVEFRYNTRKLEDGARVAALVRACEGKRLTYRPA